MTYPFTLAQQTTKKAGLPNALRTGIVTAVSANGVVVNVAGGLVKAGVQGGAQGVSVGATVGIFKQDQSWVVTGATNGAGNGRTNSGLIGCQLVNQGATFSSGIGTGSGEVFSNVIISSGKSPVPLNHLIQVRMMVNFVITVASGQVGARIRVGAGITGLQLGSGHGFGPTASFTYELWAEGWFLGDGQPHIYGLTVQNFTGGTMSISSNSIAPGIVGIFDWGDATGITQI